MVDGALLHDGHVAAGSGRASAGTMERRKRGFFLFFPIPFIIFVLLFSDQPLGHVTGSGSPPPFPLRSVPSTFIAEMVSDIFFRLRLAPNCAFPCSAFCFLFANGASCREETSRHDTDERMIAITVGHGRRGLPPGSLLPPKPRQSTTRERSRPPAAESKPASTTKKKRTEGCDSSRQNVKIGKKA